MTTMRTLRTLAPLVLALAVVAPAAAQDYNYTYNEADQLVRADPVAGSVEMPQSLHRYSYALNNPNKYHDPNGELFDTILDIGFIGYDVYRIVADNVIGRMGNLKENLLALGADIGGACIPFATGGGAAVRIAARGDDVIDGVRMAKRGVDGAKSTLKLLNPPIIITEKGMQHVVERHTPKAVEPQPKWKASC